MLSVVPVAVLFVASTSAATITMYSDAQCPCSAQFVSDVEAILNHPSFANLTDFVQFFIPKCMDAVDTCAPMPSADDLKCVHGDEECVGQRYFLCAQHLTVWWPNASVGDFPTYRTRGGERWFQFQQCSYGACEQCDVFTELFCLTPCTTYRTFTRPDENDIMRECAAKGGFDWAALQQCAAKGAPLGDALQHASAARCHADGAAYGTKGLPVVTLTVGAAPPVRVRTGLAQMRLSGIFLGNKTPQVKKYFRKF